MMMCLQVQQQLELVGRWVGDAYFSFCRAIVFAILADIASMWKPWAVLCLKDVRKFQRIRGLPSIFGGSGRVKTTGVAHAHTSLQKQTPYTQNTTVATPFGKYDLCYCLSLFTLSEY
jgi:hypothetical protein